jgi:hypothetical protein
LHNGGRKEPFRLTHLVSLVPHFQARVLALGEGENLHIPVFTKPSPYRLGGEQYAFCRLAIAYS